MRGLDEREQLADRAVEIRIYAWSATGATGTFRVQNTFSVSGTLQ